MGEGYNTPMREGDITFIITHTCPILTQPVRLILGCQMSDLVNPRLGLPTYTIYWHTKYPRIPSTSWDHMYTCTYM